MSPSTDARPRGTERCPQCGEEAEDGQLVCLSCGNRLALDYRRHSGWQAPTAVVLVVLAAAAAAFAVTLAAVDDDAQKEVAAAPARATGEVEEGRGAGRRESRAGAKDKEAARKRRQAARRRREAARRGEAERSAPSAAITAWPAKRNGFMVVLLSTPERNGARDFARRRRRDGADGVLRADDYPSLSGSSGFYIVFAGPYPSRGAAERAAGKLQRAFPGVFVQFVNGKEKR